LDELSLAALEAVYRGCGSSAHRPDLMLKIVLWEMFQGRPSPAQWGRDVHENTVVQWLGRGIQPSRSACYDFRDRMGDAILEIHAEAVRLGIAEGLIDPREGVLDGTFVRACASRHRLLNRSLLERRREELAAAIARDEAGQLIQTVPRWMAQTAAGRQQQSRRFARADEVLTRRLAENASRPKDKRLPENRVTINPSDPEAPVGRDKEKVCCRLYTAQYLVEPNSLVILSVEVFAQATDSGTLAPMLDRTQEVTGRLLEAVTANAA